ncbi:MAG: tRNA pseudouridine(13) synthase TruD [Myxococcales bacterium]|nr:tRNA pseudouridine(13) synthase TruD [Myxococcales bacterium]
MVSLPFLTADLPGIGGLLRETPQDFAVFEELPYAPSGAGDHVFAFIEKVDCTTPFAIDLLARALGVSPRDIGVAGMKDRRAVTRQWVSLPPPVTLAQVTGLSLPGLQILEACPHPHKLRTGHVRANRFVIVVRRTGPAAAAAASAVLTALAAAPGAPNWYGEQRFGRAGDNAAMGLAMMRKQRRFDRDPRKNRLLLSALQSDLFNRWLARRIHAQEYRQVLEGDLLRKVGGGVFVCTDPAVDQPRLLAGEVLTTGPMFGVEMRGPTPGSPAHAREAAVLEEAGLALSEFAAVRKLAPGARRDAAVAIADWAVEQLDDDAVRISFTLPAGAYATAVLREVQKPVSETAPAAHDGDGHGHGDAGERDDRGAGDDRDRANEDAAMPRTPSSSPSLVDAGPAAQLKDPS